MKPTHIRGDMDLQRNARKYFGHSLNSFRKNDRRRDRAARKQELSNIIKDGVMDGTLDYETIEDHDETFDDVEAWYDYQDRLYQEEQDAYEYEYGWADGLDFYNTSTYDDGCEGYLLN